MSIIMFLVLAFSTPCETEDAMNCTWLAQTQGNGQGTSFIDIMGLTIELDGI